MKSKKSQQKGTTKNSTAKQSRSGQWRLDLWSKHLIDELKNWKPGWGKDREWSGRYINEPQYIHFNPKRPEWYNHAENRTYLSKEPSWIHSVDFITRIRITHELIRTLNLEEFKETLRTQFNSALKNLEQLSEKEYYKYNKKEKIDETKSEEMQLWELNQRQQASERSGSL